MTAQRPSGRTGLERASVHAIVLLHGHEDDPDRLVSALRPALAPLSTCEILAPRGPHELAGGPAWLPGAEPDPGAVRAALEKIDAELVTACERLACDRSDVIIGGFSQGGAAALAATLTARDHDRPVFAGCFAVSGFLWPPDTVDYDFAGATNTPFLFVHGGADEAVPPAQGRSAARLLSRRGASVVYREHAGVGHDPAAPAVVADVGEWLAAIRRDGSASDPSV